MPPSSRREPRAAPVRRSAARPAAPHPLARRVVGRTAVRQRPDLAPFVVFFACLVAAEDLYVGWLLWEPDPGWHWYVLVAVALAAWALLGAVLVWRGKPRGWVVLALAGTLPLLFLLALAFLVSGLGGGGQVVWWALAMLIGPLGCLLLTCQRSIREWTAPRRDPQPSARTRRTGSAG